VQGVLGGWVGGWVGGVCAGDMWVTGLKLAVHGACYGGCRVALSASGPVVEPTAQRFCNLLARGAGGGHFQECSC
jgi:hypothetical protein